MIKWSSSLHLAVFSALANLLVLAPSIHSLQIYDRVLSSRSVETLVYITLITAAALVAFGYCEALRERLANRMSARFTVEHTEELFTAINRIGEQRAKCQEMLRNFSTVRLFIASKAFTSLFDLPFSPVYLLILFLINFKVGLLITCGAIFLAAVAYLNKKTTAESQRLASNTSNKALEFANAVSMRSEDIKAMGLLPQLVDRWGSMMAESLQAQESANQGNAFFSGLSRAVRQILQISIMGWGAYLVLAGDMSGGLIFAVSMISGKALQPIEQLIGGWENINRAKLAADALAEFLNDAAQMPEQLDQPVPTGLVTIEKVSFTVGKSEILSGINFTIQPGEFLGIVGPSGAGKSTLGRIIAGASNPTEGNVILDGCSRKNWSDEQWGQYVGYVAQETSLFPATVAENISRMAVDPDESRIVDAARAAGVHDLINAMPNSYATMIGDGKFRLSGGQTQRIAMARALYSSPKLLVLDEPNAHLDSAGDATLALIISSLKSSGVTVVAITHRNDILKSADRVLLLKDGKQVGIQNVKKSETASTAPHKIVLKLAQSSALAMTKQ